MEEYENNNLQIKQTNFRKAKKEKINKIIIILDVFFIISILMFIVDFTKDINDTIGTNQLNNSLLPKTEII